MCCILSLNGSSQIIFSEPFDESDGSTNGVENSGVGTTWFSTCPSCVSGDWFEVQGGILEGRDTGGPASFTSGIINTSSCDQVDISFDISQTGDMEDCNTGCNSADWVQLEYRIDGGTWQAPGNSTFCAGACANVDIIQSGGVTGVNNYSTGCFASGNTLEIRITVQCWASSEYWKIDNIEVNCISVDPGTDGGITFCDTDAPADLFDELGGTPDNGGSWSGPSTLTNGDQGTFTPGTSNDGLYTYTVGPAGCPQTSTVTVTVNSCVNCTITNLNVNVGGCQPNDTYDITGSVEFTNPPSTGQLIIEDCNGNQDTYSAPFSSPQTFSFNAGTANGSPCDVTAYFTDDLACTQNFSYTAPTCSCNIDTVAVGPPSCNEMVSWDGSINVAATGGTPPTTISWFNANDLTTPIGGNVGQLTQLAPGTYWAYVEDASGCKDSIEVELIAPDPISIDSTIERVSCPDSLDGSITVFDIQNTTGSLTFDWTPNGEITQSIDSLSGGNYGLTITDQNGCIGEFQFTVSAPPPILLNNTTVINSDCFPGENGNGQVSAQATGGWTGNFSFEWYNIQDTSINSGNPTWGNRPPGDYALIATDDEGCVVTDTFTVEENPVIAGVESNPNNGIDPLNVIFTNTSTTDSATVADEFTYIWNLDNGTSFETDDVDTLIEDIYNSGIYEITLIVRNINGCRDTATVVVEVIPPLEIIIPNVFTPNNDGANDLFSFNLQGVESFYCVIFDRWGKKVTEWNDPTMGWDGTNLNGKDVTEGVYTYMYEIIGLDGVSSSGHGHVHLKR